MKLGDDLLRELLATFAVEAAEHIHAINAHLLALEKGPEPDEARELLAEIFREAHSLKGAARIARAAIMRLRRRAGCVQPGAQAGRIHQPGALGSGGHEHRQAIQRLVDQVEQLG